MKGKFKFLKKVPQETIKKVWHQQFPHDKRVPPIRMFVLGREEFRKTAEKERKRLGDTSKREYGHWLPTKNVQGMLMHEKRGYLILHEQGGGSPLITLTHELHHIHKKGR